MTDEFVNIHTHKPTGQGIELRTVGVHPWKAGTQDVAALEPLSAKVQAIGEIGLDFVRGPSHEMQTAAFRSQLELARRHSLPVVLHCVKAFEPVMRELAVCEPRAVIFHGFIGSTRQALRAIAKGYYLSFGERAFASPRTLEALRAIPANRLFLETDESDTPIAAIYARAAEALGTTLETLRRTTRENYERIFCIPHER